MSMYEAAGGGSPEVAARIMLRPIATPLALGFLGLGGATVVVSGQQLHWYDPAQSGQVFLVLLAFAAPLQAVAALFAFLARDVGGATGMGVLSACWTTYALLQHAAGPGARSDVLGIFLIFAGAVLLVPAAAAAGGKIVVALVLTTAGFRFVLSGVYQLTGSDAIQNLSGIVGVVLFAAAAYTALALTLEDALGHTQLPVGRHRTGAAAIRGSLPAQLSGIASEAGVRKQL